MLGAAQSGQAMNGFEAVTDLWQPGCLELPERAASIFKGDFSALARASVCERLRRSLLTRVPSQFTRVVPH